MPNDARIIEIIIGAMVDDDLDWHESQIQGFLYGKDHVIRDCTKQPGEQEIFRAPVEQCDGDVWDRQCQKERARIRARAALDALRAEGVVVVPVEPSDGLLMSMAIRSDHALGCKGFYDQPLAKKPGITHAMRVKSAIRHMRQIHEEVVGTGFYSPEKEDGYCATLIAASQEEA